MKKKRYCYSCGGKVKITEIVWAFDEYFGKPLTVEQVKCPKRRWYHFGHYVTAEEAYRAQAGYL